MVKVGSTSSLGGVSGTTPVMPGSGPAIGVMGFSNTSFRSVQQEEASLGGRTQSVAAHAWPSATPAPSVVIPATLEEMRGGDAAGVGKVTANLMKTITNLENALEDEAGLQSEACTEATRCITQHGSFSQFHATVNASTVQPEDTDSGRGNPDASTAPPSKQASSHTLAAFGSPASVFGLKAPRKAHPDQANGVQVLLDEVHRMEVELEGTREQLGMLQQSVEGRMVHDPCLDFDRRTGNIQLIGMERAHKSRSKVAFCAFLVALAIFVAEAVVYLTMSTGWPRWRCRDLCGSACYHGTPGYDAIGQANIPSCESRLTVGYAEETDTFYALTHQCYQPGYADSWLRVVPKGTACSTQGFLNATFALSVPVAGMLLPVAGAHTGGVPPYPQPVLLFSNASAYGPNHQTPASVGYAAVVAGELRDNASHIVQEYGACVWMVRDSVWQAAEWAPEAISAKFASAGARDLGEVLTYGGEEYRAAVGSPALLRRLYAVWGSRRSEEDCVPDLVINQGYPKTAEEVPAAPATPASLGPQEDMLPNYNRLTFYGRVQVSAWARYVVILMRVRNDPQKSQVSALADIGLSPRGERSALHRVWGERAAQGVLTVQVYQEEESGGELELITNSTIRLTCEPDAEFCEREPVLRLWDTAEHPSPVAVQKNVTVVINSHAAVELAWEEVQFQAFTVYEVYTIGEAAVRLACFVLILVAFVNYASWIRYAGGWFSLLPEQCWMAVFLVMTLFFFNPIFILDLYSRDTSNSKWARLAYFMEVDMGYYSPYVFVALNLTIIMSAYTRDEPLDFFFQYIPMKLSGYSPEIPTPKTQAGYYSARYLRALRRRRPSLISALIFAAFLLLAIVGAVGRVDTPWSERNSRSDFGATDLQDTIAMIMSIVAGGIGVYVLYKVRRKLRGTHYVSSRRQQLLLRLVYFVSIPVLCCNLVNIIIDSRIELSTYLVQIEDSEIHRRMGMFVLTFVYCLIMANALQPLRPFSDADLPPPSYREHWTALPFAQKTHDRLRITHCNPYFFLTYTEEMRWLHAQTGGDWGWRGKPRNKRLHEATSVASIAGVVAVAVLGQDAALCSWDGTLNGTPANGDNNEPYGGDADLCDIGTLAVSVDSGLMATQTDPCLLSDNGQLMGTMNPPGVPAQEGTTVSDTTETYHGQNHLFSLQVAAEMAILSQEVYLNPPLRVLLKTSKILRRGPTPGCCVLVAAAVIPRTLFGRTLVGRAVTQEVQKKRKKRRRKKRRSMPRGEDAAGMHSRPSLWCFDAAESEGNTPRRDADPNGVSMNIEMGASNSLPGVLVDKDLELYRDHLLRDELNIARQTDTACEDSLRRGASPPALIIDPVSTPRRKPALGGSPELTPVPRISGKLSSVVMPGGALGGEDVNVLVRTDADDDHSSDDGANGGIPRSARARLSVSLHRPFPSGGITRAHSAIPLPTGSDDESDGETADLTTVDATTTGTRTPPIGDARHMQRVSRYDSDRGYVVTLPESDDSPVVKQGRKGPAVPPLSVTPPARLRRESLPPGVGLGSSKPDDLGISKKASGRNKRLERKRRRFGSVTGGSGAVGGGGGGGGVSPRGGSVAGRSPGVSMDDMPAQPAPGNTTPPEGNLQRKPSMTKLKKWLGFGFQDPYADCHDEYRFEPNSEAWAQNISRSFMDLGSFGWTLKSLLDRKDNRAMITTKLLEEESGDKLLLVAVVFRGTRNTSNLKSDLQINRQPYKEMADLMGSTSWADENPCAHRGFSLVWEMLKDDLLEVVNEELQKAADAGMRVRIICTGHSLGGALATLASYTIARRHPETWVSLYNYGTPRVGNATFCRLFRRAVPDAYGMVHPADPVPNHPPKFNLGVAKARYAHPFQRVRIDTYGNILITPSWIEGFLMDSLPFSLVEPFDTQENIKTGHSMKTYRAALRAICNWGGQDHGLQASLDRA